MDGHPQPIRGIEIRERRTHRGEDRYAYRVRFRNARGERKGRTFDCLRDALDFRARLRLLKRTGDLPALDAGSEALGQLMDDYWRLYAEPRLARATRERYRGLWTRHINRRLGGMELRQISQLVLSEFIAELQQDGVGAPTVRSCLGLLQSIFARAVEWDRVRVNVVKLIAKPRARRARAVKPLSPANVEALRRQMLRNSKHGLRDATLVSVLAYAGLRPSEALALEYQHVRDNTILIEQKWIDGEILPGQKTNRPPRFPPLLDALRVDLHDYELACSRTRGLIFAQANGAPWHDY